MADYVDLDQKVNAQYYDEMTEEWDLKTTTIGHILDSVCDDYKVAVDAVEVVRCKDCKHSFPTRSEIFVCCKRTWKNFEKDFFCKYGEGAENGSNDQDEYPVCFNMI